MTACLEVNGQLFLTTLDRHWPGHRLIRRGSSRRKHSTFDPSNISAQLEQMGMVILSVGAVPVGSCPLPSGGQAAEESMAFFVHARKSVSD
jgi:hypothetical protein